MVRVETAIGEVLQDGSGQAGVARVLQRHSFLS